MNLTGEQHFEHSFERRLLLEDTQGLTRTWALLAPAIAFSVIVMLDRVTESTAVSHLYYLPIVFAAIRFGLRGGFAAAAASVILFHLANRSPWNWHYGESDMLRISMYLAIAILAERQTTQLRQLHKLASTDDLTGLHNLRAFEARLDYMLRRARQHGTSVALMVLDVDHLKALNDVYGHLAGAEAVQAVGHVLATRLPANALASRYGGDEFVIAVPEYKGASPADVAEDLRRTVNALVPTLAGIRFPAATISISVGVACWHYDHGGATNGPFDADETGRALFRAADEALYAAKHDGRNRIHIDMCDWG